MAEEIYQGLNGRGEGFFTLLTRLMVASRAKFEVEEKGEPRDGPTLKSSYQGRGAGGGSDKFTD